MARGSLAKDYVTKKIIETFGSNECFVYDKKLYITTKEDGAPIQVCLSFTCPKTLVEPSGSTVAVEPPKSAFSGGIDFESLGGTSEPTAFKPAEITEQEKETVRDLMARLGL